MHRDPGETLLSSCARHLTLSPWLLSRPALVLRAVRNHLLHKPQVYVGDHTVLTRTVFGHLIYVDGRDLTIGPHLLLRGHWETDISRLFLRLVKPGMRVVEVGANVGYYTLLASSLVGSSGKVFGFEANPSVAALARRSVMVNGLGERTRIINLAVTDRPGTVTLHCLEYTHGGSSLFDFSDQHLEFLYDRVTKLEVPATSLDHFFEDDDGPIDVIKIDAEGSEPFVFDGMRRIIARNRYMKILLEFFPERIHRSGRDPAAFLESIMATGFRVQTVGRRGRLQPAPVGPLAERELAELLLSR